MTPNEQKLARRIHNQQVALRDNWQIVEMRADYKKKSPIQTRLLTSALKHARGAREAKEALTSLIFMVCLLGSDIRERE